MSQQPLQSPSADVHPGREPVDAVLRAARFGLEAYPGPVGELIDRELRAYVDGGRRLPPDAVPERLLAILLHDLEREAAEAKGTLPARYKKGTPLGWEYTPRDTDGAEGAQVR
ncbi:hypothetical protein [Pseudonocardia sp.]|uniref:hypothetical protein n=1 Tax=Pseudonocardia sp. TaxID=60912 RepID=UPI003D14C11A